MKILLAQINTVVGAIDDNAGRVREVLAQAREQGAELAVFPEMALTGYPPQDLLEYEWFVEKNERALEELAKATDDALGAVVGYVGRGDPATGGKGLFNSVALIGGGRVISRHAKSLLPTYDVFDERRWFDPAPAAQTTEWRGRRLALTICEDCWNAVSLGQPPLYNINPIDELLGQEPDILINIAASPFTLGKREIKRELFRDIARRGGVSVVHLNLVGGNDSLVFDGWSNAFASDGSLIAQAVDFEEDLLLVDLDKRSGSRHSVASADVEQVRRALVLGVRDYLHKCGFSKAVIGLSGGIDSALTATLAAQALGPENVMGVSMPSRYSSDHSKDDARILAENLGIEYRVVPIEGMFRAFEADLAPVFGGLPPDLAEENIQARCRGVTLMAISNKLGHLVLSTGNKSESAVGYATLYGDMCGGLAVIGDLPKTLVYDLARHINRDGEVIPQGSIDKAPSAELRPDQKDSDSLPDYDLLDQIINAWVEGHQSVDEIIAAGHDAETVRKTVRMINQSEYKRRQAPPILKITTKAFGFGRRMPIAAII